MYDFKERQLPESFAERLQRNVEARLHPSGFFTLVGMPSVGISFFLRFLATKKNASYTYLDLLSLATPTKHNFYQALFHELGGIQAPLTDQEILTVCKELLRERLKDEKQHIILINRFNVLDKEIDAQLLGNLRTLRHFSSDRLSFILAAHKSFYDHFAATISGANLDMFSNFLFFTPYEEKDLLLLLRLFSEGNLIPDEEIRKAVVLSGGHFQLAKLILKSRKKQSLLSDRSLSTALRDIYSSLTYPQKKLLRKIVLGKKVESVDEELLDFGIISSETNHYKVFSPLFTQYLINSIPIKLPVKELKLFNLLKKNSGHVVTKDEIFQEVWNETDNEFGSDWALNALIYRLRKNSTFKASGYSIENYKKVGYLLLKE